MNINSSVNISVVNYFAGLQTVKPKLVEENAFIPTVLAARMGRSDTLVTLETAAELSRSLSKLAKVCFLTSHTPRSLLGVWLSQGGESLSAFQKGIF